MAIRLFPYFYLLREGFVSNLQSKYHHMSSTGSTVMERRHSVGSCQLPATSTVQHQALQAQQLASSESSEAIVSRIYEEELTKLAEQAKVSGNVTEYQLYQVSSYFMINREFN